MQPETRRRLFAVLRVVLGIAALAYVISQLSWASTATLRSGEHCTLIKEQSDSLVVEVDGERQTLPFDAFEPAEKDGARPKIEYGVRDVFDYLDWRYALIGLLVFAPCPIILAVRLKWLLEAQDIPMRLWPAVKITYAGNFMNFVLPGMTGGDLVKGYYAAKHTHRKHAAFAIVLFDRALGMFCLILLGGIMVLVGWSDPAVTGYGKMVGGVLLALVVGALIYFSATVRRWMRYDKWIRRIPLGSHIARLDEAAFFYRRHPRILLKCILLTLGLQVTSVTSVFFGGWALQMVGEHPLNAIVAYLLYVPLGWVIAAVPLTPQGIGIMEGAYIHFFVDAAKLADSASQAFFLAMIGRLFQMVWALPGLWIAFSGEYHVTSENSSPEEVVATG